MNGHRITNLAQPAAVDGDLDAVPNGYLKAYYLPKGVSLTAIQNANQAPVDLFQQKIVSLAPGTESGDAVEYDQFHTYVVQTAPDTYRSRLSTLSEIQVENPAPLAMGNQKITGVADPTLPQDVVTLEYFNSHGSGGGTPDQIANQSGFTSVTCTGAETVSIVANTEEVILVEPTQVVVSQPIFSTTVPAADPSNQLLTKSQLDPYYTPTGTTYDQIQNATDSAIVKTNTDGTVSMKANGGSSSLVVSASGSQYTLANSGNLTLQTNGILNLSPASYTQATTPILSTSTAPSSQYQLLNRNQNDSRYYQSTTPLNSLTTPTGDVEMSGHTLSNIRDAVANLEPTNLAQVESLIANSGFKNKIQS